MKKIVLARALVVAGFAVGLTSLYQTFSHIGDPDFIQVGGEALDHSYYHFFREGGGDIAAMLAILFFLFAKEENRTRTTWVMSLLVVLGYYLPYWVGMPFNVALAAPHFRAELAHILQAALVFSGVLIARAT